MPLELEEQFYETERARLQRWLPWVHLFRTFRLATRWQNLALGVLAVMALAAGRWGLAHLPIAQGSDPDAAGPADTVAWPWEQEFLSPPLPALRHFSWNSLLADPVATLTDVTRRWRTVYSPLTDFLAPIGQLFQLDNRWSDTASAWLELLLVVLVGSVFGAAITRRVAVEFAGKGEPGLRASLRFSLHDIGYTLGAPFISLVGLGLLFGIGWLIAWLGAVTSDSGALAAALWGLLMFLSLLATLILVGVALTWPLMIAAHAAEGTDGYDALNRAYNYVFVRPWYALWMVAVGGLYAAAVITAVMLLTAATLHVTDWIADGPLATGQLHQIKADAPPLLATDTIVADDSSAGRILGGAWYRGVATLLTGFVYSLFWTLVTLIYFILRRSVDGYELDRVYLPTPPPPPDQIPLVGMPAAERRETRRASAATGEDSATNADSAGSAESPAPEAPSVPADVETPAGDSSERPPQTD